MSHFSPDLDDLRSEDWGGRPRQVVHWQFSACWLLVSLLIPVFIFDSRIGSFFTSLLTHLRLWLPFWFAVGAGCFCAITAVIGTIAARILPVLSATRRG